MDLPKVLLVDDHPSDADRLQDLLLGRVDLDVRHPQDVLDSDLRELRTSGLDAPGFATGVTGTGT